MACMAIRFIPANDQFVPSITGQLDGRQGTDGQNKPPMSFALKRICS